MCQIFAALPPETYAFHTRSVRLGGHATSIRLELRFWLILEEIAEAQGVGLPKFLTKLHDEILERHGEVANFASLLRCACLTWLDEVRGRDDAERSLDREARRSFGGALVAAE